MVARTDMSRRNLQVRRERRQRELVEIRERLRLPKPKLAATVTDPSADFVPRSPRSTMRMLDQAGWRSRLTRAIGPRIDARGKVVEMHCASLCVAAVSPSGRRMVWEWNWKPARGSWELICVLDLDGEGLINDKQAKQIVKGDAP